MNADAESEIRKKLRNWGWVVAVHNDYRQDGVPHTFWLFTSGKRCIKGEGRTDAEALLKVWEEAGLEAAEGMARSHQEADFARAQLIQDQETKDLQEKLANSKLALDVAITDAGRYFDIAKKLRAAMPSLALPARSAPHPMWKLDKLTALYPDPNDPTDYVSNVIDADVIRAACAAADAVLSPAPAQVPVKAYTFKNGMLMVFDAAGDQVPEWQGESASMLDPLRKAFPGCVIREGAMP